MYYGSQKLHKDVFIKILEKKFQQEIDKIHASSGLNLEFSNKNPDHVINLVINQHEFHRFINEKKLEIMTQKLNRLTDKIQQFAKNNENEEILKILE